jgi:alginate O-acetyltransferase complex protein AlgI
MIFSSPVFLFVFLPIVLSIYFLVPRFLKNTFLLLSSLVFYFWDERKYGFVIIFSILINYFFVFLINKFRANEKQKKLILITALIFNIGLLVIFKYLSFIVRNLDYVFDIPDSVLQSVATIHLVAGISFFTFHAISYVVDVYHKEKPLKNIIDVSLYFAFFPQLIAGPIIRYHTIVDQLIKRSVTVEMFTEGVNRFILGLSKKILIANTLGTIVDNIFSIDPLHLNAQTAWFGITCYALQLYFDFSGYSDMAIGMAKMFGFNFMENFNYPYISQSITDFWRRWHISLSSWFRDYVYIPLGGNRKGTFRTLVNLFAVFLLCGFWHGASWNFIVWGIWHGYFLVIERLWVGTFLEKIYRPLRHVYAIVIITIGWVFFRSRDLTYAVSYLKSMFGLNHPGDLAQSFYISNITIIAFIAGIIFSLPILKIINNLNSKYIKNQYVDLAGSIIYSTILVGLLLLSTVFLATNTYNPFIYYRF